MSRRRSNGATILYTSSGTRPTPRTRRAGAASGRELARPRDERVALLDAGTGAHPVEEGARLAKDLVGRGIAERGEATSLPEKRIRLLERGTELLPARGGLGEETGRFFVLAARFRDERLRTRERPLRDRDQLNHVAKVSLAANLRTGRIVKTVADPMFDVPTTVDAQGKRLYVANARFGTPGPGTADYWLTRIAK